MEMEEEWKMLKTSINEFASSLKVKGYDGTFLTQGAYPDDLDKSIERYLYASMLGDEPGLRKGISLQTYLRWNEERKDNIVIHFKVSFGYQNKLAVREISIEKKGSYLAESRRIEIRPINYTNIPSKAEIAKMIDPLLKIKIHHSHRVSPR